MRQELEAIAREAGDRAMDWFGRRGELGIESKGPLDLVSEADRDLEVFIAERLRRLYPMDGILGEEGEGTIGTSRRTWVLDPIDGTFNFVRGGPEWGISIGLHDGNRPGYGAINLPVLGQLFSGGTSEPARLNGQALPPLREFDPKRASLSIGLVPEMPVENTLAAIRFVLGEAGFAVRASGSCICGLMEVARGETDVYLGLAEHSWDVMAALPIVQSLGGECSLNWSRTTLTDRCFFAAGKPAAVERLLPLFKSLS